MLTVLIILLVLAALFLLTLQGRRNHPLWETFLHQRFCHRGYHDKPQIPENSLPAFRRAIERGWGAELDVHLLKDGTLAVFHDSDLSRCAGVSGMIEDLTLPELKKLRLEGTDEKSRSLTRCSRCLRMQRLSSSSSRAQMAITLPSQRPSVSG